MIQRLLPCLGWLRRYDGTALRGDGLAAVIVTIMLIPQSLAYALLAELYPSDQATGFQQGDIRGAFTITQPVAQ